MEDLLDELSKLLKQKKSRTFYAEKLGISEEEVDKLKKELRGETKDIEEDSFKYSAIKNEIVVSKIWDERPTTEELIKYHGIDDSWYLTEIQTKQLVKGISTTATFNKRTTDSDLSKQKDFLLKEMKSHSSSAVLTKVPKKSNSLLEISIPDLHIGKHSWREETSEDYDISIAVDRYNTAISELLSRVNLSQVERILFPIGNDLINVDNENNLTFAGTPQDCDSRFAKMVKVSKELLISSLQDLSKIAPVDVVIVKGNHDSTVTFLLGEILDAWFHNNPNINVDNSPKWRKYYQYHSNSFMYTHGDKEKHSDLGLIFATENARLWADTKYRFVKLGHLHKYKKTDYITVDSHTGFQVEILPSLSGTDEWHYSKGYLSNKQAKAYLYHPTEGEIAQYTYTV